MFGGHLSGADFARRWWRATISCGAAKIAFKERKDTNDVNPLPPLLVRPPRPEWSRTRPQIRHALSSDPFARGRRAELGALFEIARMWFKRMVGSIDHLDRTKVT